MAVIAREEGVSKETASAVFGTKAALIGELYRTLHAGRRANPGRVAQAICGLEGLRGGLGVEDVTELLWQLASPELYGLMTGIGGRSRDLYAVWLAQMLTASLPAERT